MRFWCRFLKIDRNKWGEAVRGSRYKESGGSWREVKSEVKSDKSWVSRSWQMTTEMPEWRGCTRSLSLSCLSSPSLCRLAENRGPLPRDRLVGCRCRPLMHEMQIYIRASEDNDRSLRPETFRLDPRGHRSGRFRKAFVGGISESAAGWPRVTRPDAPTHRRIEMQGVDAKKNQEPRERWLAC